MGFKPRSAGVELGPALLRRGLLPAAGVFLPQEEFLALGTELQSKKTKLILKLGFMLLVHEEIMENTDDVFPWNGERTEPFILS